MEFNLHRDPTNFDWNLTNLKLNRIVIVPPQSNWTRLQLIFTVEFALRLSRNYFGSNRSPIRLGS